MEIHAGKVPSFDDPTRCYEGVAHELREGVTSPQHPFRLFTLATIGIDGFPEARTLVLREFDESQRRIEFHIDARSPKMEQLRYDSRVTLLFNDVLSRWQLRIRGRAEIHHLDDVAEASWKTTRSTSRGNYASPYPSGSIISDEEVWVPPKEIPDDAKEVSANFVVARSYFQVLDIYMIRDSGHLRYKLQWQNNVWNLIRIAP